MLSMWKKHVVRNAFHGQFDGAFRELWRKSHMKVTIVKNFL